MKMNYLVRENQEQSLSLAKSSIKIICILFLLSSTIFAKAKFSNLENPKQVIKISMGKSRNAPGQNVMKYCYFYNNYVMIEIKDPAVMGATSVKVYPMTNAKVDFNSFCRTPPNKAHYYDIENGLYGYYVGKFDDLILITGPDSFGAGTPFQIFRISKQGHKLILQDWQANKEGLQFIKAKNGVVGINYWRVVDSDCSLLVNGNACWQKILRENKITKKLLQPQCMKEYKRDKSPLDNPTQVLLHVEIPDLNKPLIRDIVEERTKCHPRP